MTEPSPVRKQLEQWRDRADDWSLESGHIRNDLEDATDLAEWLLDGIEEAHQLTRHHEELWASKVINDIDKVLERLLKGRSYFEEVNDAQKEDPKGKADRD